MEVQQWVLPWAT